MPSSASKPSPGLTADDRAEISDLIAGYGVFQDRREFYRLAEVFTDDVVFEYPVGALNGLREFRAFLDKALFLDKGSDGWTAAQHMMHTTLVEEDGDEASGFIHVTAHHAVGSLPARPEQVYTITGTYRDQYVRTGAGWRISHRLFTPITIVGDRAALGMAY
ncbi:nuclear transport factor 2 family protein [Gordonia McavH-238-E]|uniref:nuclear transport factor 2 family protein n=1 Tax=Gordonia sp. McavH-238-E TaxID=2917736 RepID=UPI001EF4A885|nr:nuclear transport factor 2 family protein [Gordonia sp. McavH-238-E]MCG7632806.1 nuclear transport factor 2 family protein [Gordonia sp. McavH-238-E]